MPTRVGAIWCLNILAHRDADAARVIARGLATPHWAPHWAPHGSDGDDGRAGGRSAEDGAERRADEGGGARCTDGKGDGEGGAKGGSEGGLHLEAGGVDSAMATLMGTLAMHGALAALEAPQLLLALSAALDADVEAASAAVTALLQWSRASSTRASSTPGDRLPASPQGGNGNAGSRTSGHAGSSSPTVSSAVRLIVGALLASDGQGAAALVRILERPASSPIAWALAQNAATLLAQLVASEAASSPTPNTSRCHLCETFRQAGGTEALVEALRRTRGLSMPVAGKAVLAHNGADEVADTPVHAPPGASLVETRDGCEEAAVQALLAALHALVSTGEAAQHDARRAGAIGSLLGLLRCTPYACGTVTPMTTPTTTTTTAVTATTTTMHALVALAAFTARNQPNRDALREAGAVRLLLSLVDACTQTEVALAAVECLTHLAACTPATQNAIADEGGLVALVAFGAAKGVCGRVVDRCLYECAVGNERNDAAILYARRALARGHLSLSRREEWPVIHAACGFR